MTIRHRDPVSGTTMLPLRFLGDLMGAEVIWKSSDQTVTFSRGDMVVQLGIGKKTAVVNGKMVELLTPPANINGRTMVPLRFVSENLGARVNWDPAAGMITIQILLDEPELTVG